MTHPLIPQILDLAAPVAEDLGLDVVAAVFQTNQRPPVLRIDIRNPQDETSLNDCEAMSRALEAVLDASDSIPDTYILEVSSPGLSDILSSDRDFIAFKGFPVKITTSEPYKGQTHWSGHLIERNDDNVRLSCKGKAIAIPRSLVINVQLN